MQWLLSIVKFTVILLLLAVIGITLGYYYFSRNLPQLTSLADYQPPLVSRVFNDRGQLLAEYADEHRIFTPFERIPLQLRRAFMAAEDEHFYQHPGVNPARIFAAAVANFKAGHTVQGGSTITQQVAKNFLLTSERSYSRKIRELILSQRIEHRLSKDDILALYLNQIYLGRGSYGVASAAWRYFGKQLGELTLAESALLAGLPKAPGRYAPHINLAKSVRRRNWVLQQMARNGFASRKQVDRALKEPVVLVSLPKSHLNNTYGSETLKQLEALFGKTTLRRQGLTILVPYQMEQQQVARRALRRGVMAIEQRQFYRPPRMLAAGERQSQLVSWAQARPWGDDGVPQPWELAPAVVERVESDGGLVVNDGVDRWQLPAPTWHWQQPKPDHIVSIDTPTTWQVGHVIWLQGSDKGLVRLTQPPSVEAALYSLDLQHGTVLARVGGFSDSFGGFDRVHQAKRQPGSAFKPLLYATALEHGLTPATIEMDTPLVFSQGSSEQFWRPENYKNRFAGAVTLRNALEHSRNLVAVRVLQQIGVETFQHKLAQLPFTRTFPAQLSMALGATEVPLDELTQAYAAIAVGGKKWRPVSIQQVQDRNGATVHRELAGFRCQICHADPVLAVDQFMAPAERVFDRVDSFLITNMMRGVIEHGTGRRARALQRPAAGKTGTTNRQVDAWFIGFTPQILTGVWTGKDSPSTMGRHETGAHAALPIWLETMKELHRGLPKADFVAPPGVEWVAIDRKTGARVGDATKRPLLEAFRIGTAPAVMDGSGDADVGSDDKSFMQSDL
ncbi:MAG: PBP1A family penicillin-binding protein [Mariprofundales bacterium]|nr:PBP1A family penicillin-binding protein [Mariprofundales bacterium]